MPLSSAKSVCFTGLNTLLVQVEVDTAKSDSISVTLVGLPDTAVKESKERVLSAILNCDYKLGTIRCTINLAPGDLKKEGPLYDLPIALSLLHSLNVFSSDLLSEYIIVGELGLSGEIRPIHGALGVALLAKSIGCQGVIVPAQNAEEAAIVDGIEVIGLYDLREAVSFFKHPGRFHAVPPPAFLSDKVSPAVNFADIRGQHHAKRALEIAAAGQHNVLLSGPPGAGKSMLAKALPGIMPDLTLSEAIEITHIHSIANIIGKRVGIQRERPFRAPHHSISYVGMIGGGQNPKPGEVSLAHRGILFLDEFPEFSRKTLEVLRQPLEDGTVTVSRAQGNHTFPTRFLLVAAMNPCPCGFLGHPQKACKDSSLEVARYRQKISGPLLDRIDMQIDVAPVTYNELLEKSQEEDSQIIKARVEKAVLHQRERYGEEKVNAHIDRKMLTKFIPLDSACKLILKEAMEGMGLSARSCDRLIKVARTIADLEGSEGLKEDHLMEALSYRIA